MEWTEPQRKELFYHVKRINRVQDQYGIGTREPQLACDALEDILSKDYDGDSVVKAVKELIRRKGRIPLPSEIVEVLSVKDQSSDTDHGDVLQGNQVVCPECGIPK